MFDTSQSLAYAKNRLDTTPKLPWSNLSFSHLGARACEYFCVCIIFFHLLQLLKQHHYYKNALQSVIRKTEDSAKHIEDTIAWTKEMKSYLAAKMAGNLPTSVDPANALLKDMTVT